MTNSKHDELLPCPFCGSDGWLNEHEGRIASGHYSAQASCSKCDNVQAGIAYERTKELAARHAVEYWNTRANQAEIGLLKKLLKGALGVCEYECASYETGYQMYQEKELDGFLEQALSAAQAQQVKEGE